MIKHIEEEKNHKTIKISSYEGKAETMEYYAYPEYPDTSQILRIKIDQ
jgi:hypothetical protein